MNKDILFSLWYDSLEGTKSQGFVYKAWCAGWEATLAQPEPFKPDWDMIEPYHERIKELEIENEKLRQALAQHEQEHESRITALEIRVAKLENPITDHEKQLMAGQRSLLRTTSVSKPEPVVEPANSATNFVESKHLAQPEQEPVAWIKVWDEQQKKYVLTNCHTASPSKPWVSLNKEEFDFIYSQHDEYDEFARVIEAALRSKNT